MNSAKVNLTVKSAKPPATFSISVSPTETIATVKGVIATLPGAPPAGVQRLLIKGKALADGKLLKEYNIAEGDTINIMTKPGYVWGTSVPAKQKGEMAPPPPPEVRRPDSLAIPVPMEGIEPTGPSHNRSNSRSRTHSRSSSTNIPDLVLSPTPPSTSPHMRTISQDVLLTVDSAAVSTPSTEPAITSSYQKMMTQPQFWVNLYAFLKNEFEKPDDASTAFEDFLLASKGNLTPNQIAAIRDAVGVHGMAGT